jgi:hypothetical protein
MNATTLSARQQILFDVTLDDRLKLALFVTCIGVALATVNDVEVNFVGTVSALREATIYI